MYVNANIV